MGFLDSISALMSFDKPTPRKEPVLVVSRKKVAKKSATSPKSKFVKSSSRRKLESKSREKESPKPSPYQGKEGRAALARENLRKELICAPGEHCFWMCDGRVLADLRELGRALTEIEDEVFNHHVTNERHDFAQWVEDILCDGDCAKKLRETNNRHDARRVVLSALNLYE